MKCNLCGSSVFADVNGRPAAVCKACGSYERTRVIKLLLDRYRLVRPGFKVLHLAPEGALANHIRPIVGEGYDPRDIDTDRYSHVVVRKFDLTSEAEDLPNDTYDLVLHSHVLEHVPCDVTSVFFHLHRSLAPTGAHVFSVPILRGQYEESLFPLSGEERTRRFGQFDHLRRWGVEDLSMTLGRIFDIPAEYDLETVVPPAELDRANIPPAARRGYTGHSVFLLRKHDIRLVSSPGQRR